MTIIAIIYNVNTVADYAQSELIAPIYSLLAPQCDLVENGTDAEKPD